MKTCLIILSALLTIPAFAAEKPDDTKPAIDAARTWLKQVDAGAYAASHASASALFQKAVTAEQWTQAGKAARGPLGALKSRKVISATAAKELPGAPDGEYVIVEFLASYANKKSAIETVTPMKEKDGSWKVSGYYIK